MTLKITQIAKIKGSQDGAIFNNFLFRFATRGECNVYDVNELQSSNDVTVANPVDSFLLDKRDLIVPHSNAVCFGTEYYVEGDEFPLLYSNIYNNYAKEEDPLVGVCCVYRVQRDCDNKFTTTLVQIIKVGFVNDYELWRSSIEPADVRPYGNFTIDTETNKSRKYSLLK